MDISFISSLLFKEIELRDVVNNSTKKYLNTTWNNMSINNICLRAIYEIAGQMERKLNAVIKKQDKVINGVLIWYLVLSVAAAIANPIISMSIFKKFFTALFCISKLEIKKFLYQKQQHKCNGCGCEFTIDLFDIDHIVPKACGGGDYLENYQLLCRTCNTTKGARPMAFLLQRIDLIRKKRREIEY